MPIAQFDSVLYKYGRRYYLRHFFEKMTPSKISFLKVLAYGTLMVRLQICFSIFSIFQTFRKLLSRSDSHSPGSILPRRVRNNSIFRSHFGSSHLAETSKPVWRVIRPSAREMDACLQFIFGRFFCQPS